MPPVAVPAGCRHSSASAGSPAAAGAVGAVCLAFPLRPPGRATAVSRLPELDEAGVPVLVVQGERDPYGMPPPGEGRTVVQVAADHALRSDLASVGAAVRAWLGHLVTTL